MCALPFLQVSLALHQYYYSFIFVTSLLVIIMKRKKVCVCVCACGCTCACACVITTNLLHYVSLAYQLSGDPVVPSHLRSQVQLHDIMIITLVT